MAYFEKLLFYSGGELSRNMQYIRLLLLLYRRCCIQLRTSFSSSTSVSFCLPPSSLNLFPFMDVTFSSFWTHSQTLFRPTLNFFSVLWIEFSWAYLILTFLNSILYFCRLSLLRDSAWFTLMSSIISTNSNVIFAKLKLKFCFSFEKSIRIRITFYKVDSKQTRSSNNSMQSNSFFFENSKIASARDDECCEFRIMHQIKFQSLAQSHHVYKIFGDHGGNTDSSTRSSRWGTRKW